MNATTTHNEFTQNAIAITIAVPVLTLNGLRVNFTSEATLDSIKVVARAFADNGNGDTVSLKWEAETINHVVRDADYDFGHSEEAMDARDSVLVTNIVGTRDARDASRALFAAGKSFAQVRRTIRDLTTA